MWHMNNTQGLWFFIGFNAALLTLFCMGLIRYGCRCAAVRARHKRWTDSELVAAAYRNSVTDRPQLLSSIWNVPGDVTIHTKNEYFRSNEDAT